MSPLLIAQAHGCSDRLQYVTLKVHGIAITTSNSITEKVVHLDAVYHSNAEHRGGILGPLLPSHITGALIVDKKSLPSDEDATHMSQSQTCGISVTLWRS
eukprot:gnl/TRDRNA2_/TRDRNA2_209818_c0_seq1.p1 gnl/TRDRNA2_/TRDRNA2_209818_c0~~gnl/TRDRNA2_/TRDRNA2_209818_c0_seq1.p1  ORF type:complete len:100 (-),score=1.25 gnl/TRDRNA2_/TRDRNA2_209818_c0_seq1:313-612(-)